MAVSARSKMLHHSIDSPVHWNTAHSQECNTAGQQFIISLQKNAEHQQNTAHTKSHNITLHQATRVQVKSTLHQFSAPDQTAAEWQKGQWCTIFADFGGGFLPISEGPHILIQKKWNKAEWQKGQWCAIFADFFRGFYHFQRVPVSSSNIYHCRSFLTGKKGVHLKESKTKLALSFCSWREIDSVWLKSICSCKKSRWLSSTFQTISTNSLTQTILTTRTTNNQNNVFVLDVLKGKFSLFIIHLHHYHPSHHCHQLTVL